MGARTETIDFGVYAILDAKPGRDLLGILSGAARAGVRVFQLRDKHDLVGVDEARHLVEAAHEMGAVLLINDRVELALECGADGVHVGPHDASVSDVRERIGDKIIGASAGDARRAQELEAMGADYLGCGAIFDAHATKANASGPKGVELIREIKAAVGIPVVGIGGIELSNIAEVIGAGADGAAVVRAICDAASPERAARELLGVVERVRLELGPKL